jgi:hypothetical protein
MAPAWSSLLSAVAVQGARQSARSFDPQADTRPAR